MDTLSPTAPPAQTGGKEHLRLLRDILEAADAATLRRSPRDFSRAGPLSPQLLTSLLLFVVADAGRSGYGLLLESFWAKAKAASLQLPRSEPVSAAAFCLARRKVRPQGIRELVWRSAERFEHRWGAEHRWRGRRVLAVDGSRVSLQRSPELWEHYGSAQGAGCPQATLSTLFDLVSKVPHDVQVAPFGANERRVLLEEHLDRLRKGDVLVLDRGYPSFEVLRYLKARGLDFAMRTRPRSGFPAVERFVRSQRRNAQIDIQVPKEYRGGAVQPLRVRAVRIDGPKRTPIVVLTSLPLKGFGWRAIQELYRMRWGVESYYGVLKGGYFGQRQYHAKSPAGIEQEVYAQALFISLSRHLMAKAARRHHVPFQHLSQKRAIMAVADHLTALLLTAGRRQSRPLLDRILTRISRGLVLRRPGRSYPRRSFRPVSKWHANGRRGGPRLA